MRSVARFFIQRSDPARYGARWLLVLLLPWLLSGLGQSALHSANCPEVIALQGLVLAQQPATSTASNASSASVHAAHHAPQAHSHATLTELSASTSAADDVCLTSLWATQALGIQVVSVPLALVARVTTRVLPPASLVSGVALPRAGLIRGPPFA